MLRMCGADRRWALTHFLDSEMREFVSRWALRCLLVESQARLAAVRDLLGDDKRRVRSRERIRQLEALRGSIDFAAEAELIGSEVETACKNASWFLRDCPRFLALSWWPDEDRPLLPELLRNESLERSMRLRRAARGVYARTQSFAELSNAITTLRLQASVWWLTAVALAISVAAWLIAALG
jgi:hypothetical protein